MEVNRSNTEPEMPRRDMLSLVVAGLGACWAAAVGLLGGIVLLAPLRKANANDRIRLGDLSIYDDDYKPIRMRVSVKDGWYERTRERIVYIRANEKGLPEVLSGTCTHLGCTVQWKQEAQEFQCPCHGGRFAPDGEVIAGPPPKRLAQLPAEVDGGDIYVTLS